MSNSSIFPVGSIGSMNWTFLTSPSSRLRDVSITVSSLFNTAIEGNMYDLFSKSLLFIFKRLISTPDVLKKFFKS